MKLIQPMVIADDRDDGEWERLGEIIDVALKRQHFSMVYQPIVSVESSKLLGFEALTRCQSPEFGVVPPDRFIPHAEWSGRILELGEWIFQQTLLDLKLMQQQIGLEDICMSINISPVQISRGNVFERLMSQIHKLDIKPQCIKIELTETALIDNAETIVQVFNAFKKEGVRVWVDDFGTGFASLCHLRKFVVDGLKIDKSFVEHIVTHNDDFTLCSAIIAMAQRLGLQVVAEGVENDSQLQILSQLGCDLVQGYLLGRPATVEQNLHLWAMV